MVTDSASQIHLVMFGQIGEPTNMNWASWGCNHMRCIRIAPKLENMIIVRIALKNVERGKQLTLQLLKYMDIGKHM